MKAWYSKVRDTELKDGSVRATYVVTFETDNAELKREVEKYLQGIMDRADRKTENSSEKPNNSTSSKMEQVEDKPQTSCKTCRFGEVDEGYVRCAYYSKATEQDEPQTPYDNCKSCKWWFGYCHLNECDYTPIEDEPQTERSRE